MFAAVEDPQPTTDRCSFGPETLVVGAGWGAHKLFGYATAQAQLR
ncbi:hypothetical protein [Nocardia nepalensis]